MRLAGRRRLPEPPTRSEINPLILGNEWTTTRAGGLNRYLSDLLGALRRGGVEPSVVVIGAADEVGVHGVSDPSAPIYQRLWETVRLCARLAPRVDVVDAHFALYALLPLKITALRNLPLVVHFQGPWAEESAVGRHQHPVALKVKQAVEGAVYRRAEVVIVLSKGFGDLVTERYGVEPSRVVILPPAVDLERFHLGDRAAARRHFTLPESSFIAVAVRRLDARMGLDVLLEAWCEVQAQRADAVLLIAGEGRERERLATLRGDLPNPERVRLLGQISEHDLVTLYQAADVSVVPTRALEGFGLVTLESLACGTPPIVTDVGGLPDGVRGLDRSLVVPPEDATALANRILAAAGGTVPSSLECRAHARTFSWETVARRHIELYRRAMGPRPSRVAYIGHTAELSGGELALARTLLALHDVDAQVFLAEDGPLVERLESAGATVEILPMGERARGLRKGSVSVRHLPLAAVADTVAYTVRLTRRLQHLRPDIVHTNTLKAALYGGIAGRLAGVPVVWHIRDRITSEYLPRPAVALVRVASRFLPRIVVTNSDSTLATLGRWPRRSSVVPSPVDFPSIEHLAASESEKPLTVGMIGRLAPWKGQDVFLRAFASAFAGGDEQAIIVGAALFGEDDWAESLPRLAETLGIAGQVEFTGFMDDVQSIYQRLDILVHASTIPEPFGQVVVEGMAHGLPVVAANTGGPAEIITDEVDGLLYPMGHVDALAERLRALAVDADRCMQIGKHAARRATRFSPERIATDLREVYRHAIDP